MRGVPEGECFPTVGSVSDIAWEVAETGLDLGHEKAASDALGALWGAFGIA